MARPLTLWIAVIADGEHARFVQPDANNTLRTVGALDFGVRASALTRHRRRPAGPLVRERRQRTPCDRPRHDPHAMEMQKFVRLVGEQISAASGRGEFDELLLVAPPRALNELREALDAATQAKLVGRLEKDLVKTPDHELWPHVREWVSPARRSVA